MLYRGRTFLHQIRFSFVVHASHEMPCCLNSAVLCIHPSKHLVFAIKAIWVLSLSYTAYLVPNSSYTFYAIFLEFVKPCMLIVTHVCLQGGGAELPRRLECFG